MSDLFNEKKYAECVALYRRNEEKALSDIEAKKLVVSAIFREISEICAMQYRQNESYQQELLAAYKISEDAYQERILELEHPTPIYSAIVVGLANTRNQQYYINLLESQATKLAHRRFYPEAYQYYKLYMSKCVPFGDELNNYIKVCMKYSEICVGVNNDFALQIIDDAEKEFPNNQELTIFKKRLLKQIAFNEIAKGELNNQRLDQLIKEEPAIAMELSARLTKSYSSNYTRNGLSFLNRALSLYPSNFIAKYYLLSRAATLESGDIDSLLRILKTAGRSELLVYLSVFTLPEVYTVCHNIAKFLRSHLTLMEFIKLYPYNFNQDSDIMTFMQSTSLNLELKKQIASERLEYLELTAVEGGIAYFFPKSKIGWMPRTNKLIEIDLLFPKNTLSYLLTSFHSFNTFFPHARNLIVRFEETDTLLIETLINSLVTNKVHIAELNIMLTQFALFRTIQKIDSAAFPGCYFDIFVSCRNECTQVVNSNPKVNHHEINQLFFKNEDLFSVHSTLKHSDLLHIDYYVTRFERRIPINLGMREWFQTSMKNKLSSIFNDEVVTRAFNLLFPTNADLTKDKDAFEKGYIATHNLIFIASKWMQYLETMGRGASCSSIGKS